jgi:S1-C subfamily serine protease
MSMHMSNVRPVLVLFTLLAAALACSPSPRPTPETPTATIPPEPISTPTPRPRTAAELASATVQVLAMVASGGDFAPIWSGSGSIISADGLILTNAHVVDDRYGEYTDLGVAVLENTDDPPRLMYLAQIAAVDYSLDLAVIRIVSDLAGNPVSPTLPFVQLGNSDTVEIGDSLQILGYPGIGGETITFTEGAVSGFTSDRSVEGRAWIKTDATIAGGNSGGLGANAVGELIGVPTRASSGAEGGDIVDCRPVADTNRDGFIDENDTCVPIGGFINGLRPVNLALPLIEAARSGVAYQPPSGPVEQPVEGFDLSNTRLYELVFADGVSADDQPTRILPALPSGTTNACAFWSYEGMLDGLTWSAYWFIDGVLSQEGSILDETWVGGQEGSWWVCIFDDSGLADGLYELVLEVEGESMINDAIFVGGDHPLVDFTVVNDTSTSACYVLISPSGARNWGQDDLGPTEIVQAGASRMFQLPAGTYDMMALECTFDVILERYGIDITSPSTFALGGGQAPAPSSGDAMVTLVNETSRAVCYVYMTPSTSTTWGPDAMGGTGIIPTGTSRDFQVASDTYDLLAQACDGSLIAQAYDVQVSASGYTWHLPFVPITLRVTNSSSASICDIFISPSTVTWWGSDWLGREEVVEPGWTREFAVPPGQNFDAMARDCGGNTVAEEYGIPITTSIYAWTAGP